MQFINKRNRNNRKRGHLISRHFLNSCWHEEIHQNVNCNYDDFSRRKDIKLLLYREQKGLCCYCMRQIKPLGSNKNATIEHVMPQKVKEEGDPFYFDKLKFFRKHVTTKAIDKTKRWKRNKFPHFCAYENLTLSCDGSLYTNEDEIHNSHLHLTCNNVRGSERIEPLFFMKHIAQDLEYGEDGLIYFTKEFMESNAYTDKYEETIDSLRLEHPTLVLIRKGWAKIAKRYSNKDVKDAINDEVKRLDIIIYMNLKINEETKLNNDIYWKLFTQYSWFGDYFRNK